MSHIDVDIKVKEFDQRLTVLRNFTFTTAPGEFIAIVGPSGSGKTTLLNIVAGMDEDFEGQVNIYSSEKYEQKKPKIGFMFQQARLMPWLSVVENIALVLGNVNSSADVASTASSKLEKVYQIIEQVGLSGFENSFPHQLSGGMQKRVSMARAFSVEPELLLLDEPFASLDSPTAQKFRMQLLDLWDKEKQTVLFVTHDLREAISLADRIVFMSDRPSSVLLDHAVQIPRPRGIDSVEVGREYDVLLESYPRLLSGQLN